MDIALVLLDMYPDANWSVEGDTYEGIVWESDDVTKPTKAAVLARMAEMDAELPMVRLRQQRNKLLTATDWWGVSDRTMTDEERTYRQALRDLPANTADPANPVWPEKPAS